MSFGNNVLFYRKKCGITQEALAEKLDVTRQTVSRWETDSAFPDMDKLLALCELFGCNMDVLVRGNAETECDKTSQVNLAAYDRHMNTYTAQITAGTCLVLTGVSAMLLMLAAGAREIAGLVALFTCITLAVAIFIAGGVAHGNFMRENPRMETYPEEKARAFRRKLPFLIAGATALILIGIIVLIAMTYEEGYAPDGFTVERWEFFAAGLFLCFVTVAVGIYVYAGMQSSKYDIKNYNKECLREGYADELPATEEKSVSQKKAEKAEKIIGAVSGAIMLTATAIFLLIGFLWKRWSTGWITFPIGGILCGIVSIIVKAVYEEK